MLKEIYSKILNGNIGQIEETNDLLGEFIKDYKNRALMPSIIVKYNRVTFVYPVSDVRITFDSNIKSGMYNYDLFDKDVTLYDVNEKGKQVLEVKFNEVLPLHISNILSDIPVCREAVSKFAICRSIK